MCPIIRHIYTDQNSSVVSLAGVETLGLGESPYLYIHCFSSLHLPLNMDILDARQLSAESEDQENMYMQLGGSRWC